VVQQHEDKQAKPEAKKQMKAVSCVTALIFLQTIDISKENFEVEKKPYVPFF
jgi:hypothetical protein